MNNVNMGYVVRNNDVMNDYISQFDPDGEYLAHWSLSGAKQAVQDWKERAGHAYTQRVWNPAKNGWNYIYSNSGLKDLNTMRKYKNSPGANTNAPSYARGNEYTTARQHFQGTLLGKAARALSAVRSRLGNGLRKATNFVNSIPNKMRTMGKKGNPASSVKTSNAPDTSHYNTARNYLNEPIGTMPGWKDPAPELKGGYNPPAKKNTANDYWKNKKGRRINNLGNIRSINR